MLTHRSLTRVVVAVARVDLNRILRICTGRGLNLVPMKDLTTSSLTTQASLLQATPTDRGILNGLRFEGLAFQGRGSLMVFQKRGNRRRVMHSRVLIVGD